MTFIDTHTHLFLPEFENDLEQVIKRATNSGINKFVLPNVDLETMPQLKKTIEAYPLKCFPLYGLHPCSVNLDFIKDLDFLRTAIENDHPLGIGETGLDYYWDLTYKTKQIESFEIQINWAKELNLPIIIHVRNSYEDTIKIIEKHQDSSLRGIFHCFTGTEDEAKTITNLGFHLGIGGVVTFKNGGLDKALPNISPDFIVLETDSPYLAPVPFRGKRNESSYINYIADKLSSIYSIELDDIAAITSKNAESIFNFSKYSG
jgi:TatD DNase family protein